MMRPLGSIYRLAAGGLLLAGTLYVAAEPAGTDAASGAASPARSVEGDIDRVVAEIDRIEAETLARLPTGAADRASGSVLLGKLLLYDKNLSVNRNEACAFCHMPETGFTGPISALNATTVAYPGSVRTRFSQRKPQTHSYAPFAPALHYNAAQGDFVGGNFWDMRSTGIRNLGLSDQEEDAIVSFMKTLTDGYTDGSK